EIALHDVRAADEKLALLPLRYGGPGDHVDDLHFGIGHHAAGGARLHGSVRRRAQVRHRGRLRHAVALGYRTAELAAELARDVLPERGGAREDQAHGGQIGLRGQRMLDETEHDGRHEREDSDAMLRHGGKELLHVEARHHEDGATVAEPQHHDDDHAVDVEEGQHGHDGVPLAEAFPVLHAVALAEVGHEVAVGQHHALG